MSHYHAGLKQNNLVFHPSGVFSFGEIPALPQYGIRGGEIFLRAGVHVGKNNGFGVRHIWDEHEKDLRKIGYQSINDVATVVASVIQRNAGIYCEFNEKKRENRVTVLRLQKGLLILEPRDERRGFGYYVVTWIPKTKAHGTLVGRIK